MNTNIFKTAKESYLNGNYLVFYNSNNQQIKRCLRINEDFKADFPDSIDLKITNKCNYNCPYCHENSISNGESFNFKNTIKILEQLPRVPIEIAIGGGNVLDIPDDTLKLITWCNDYGFKTRITINQRDIERFEYKVPRVKTEDPTSEKSVINNIGDYVDGIGISLVPDLLPKFEKNINYRRSIFFHNEEGYKIANTIFHKNIVYHIIAGLFPIDKLKMILDGQCMKFLGNLLILGYKQFGRAANTELPKSLPEFEMVVKEFISKSRNDYMNIFNIAFDNLALEQLHMKEFICEDEWDSLYLGKEGTCSMYIDAVNETYAKSSTSIERVSWKDVNLLDYFKSLRNENNN